MGYKHNISSRRVYENIKHNQLKINSVFLKSFKELSSMKTLYSINYLTKKNSNGLRTQISI